MIQNREVAGITCTLHRGMTLNALGSECSLPA